MPVNEQIQLSDLPLNQGSMISNISNQSVELMELLNHKNIKIGTKIEVKKKFTYDHSLEIKVRNHPPFTISDELARTLFVKYKKKQKTQQKKVED
jgi:DtxR family Mn-dependent transcriptional regulator